MERASPMREQESLSEREELEALVGSKKGWGRVKSAVSSWIRLARENWAAEREARLLIQSVWGVCVASRPQLFGGPQAVSVSQMRRAVSFGEPAEWAALELGRASPKALRVAFREPGVWASVGSDRYSDDAESSESWGEWLTTPLILAAMMGDEAMMRLFLEHSDDPALRRAVPWRRAWRAAKLGSEEESSDITPLLAAAVFCQPSRMGALGALLEALGSVSPSERSECLRRAPPEAAQALRACFDRCEIAGSAQPAGKRASPGGRL